MSREMLREVPVLLEMHMSELSSSKRKSAESAGTKHIHRLI